MLASRNHYANIVRNASGRNASGFRGRVVSASPKRHVIILVLPSGRVGDIRRHNAAGFCGGDVSAM